MNREEVRRREKAETRRVHQELFSGSVLKPDPISACVMHFAKCSESLCR